MLNVKFVPVFNLLRAYYSIKLITVQSFHLNVILGIGIAFYIILQFNILQIYYHTGCLSCFLCIGWLALPDN